MAYYRVCPECGCTLDPGEPCDCQSKDEKKAAPLPRERPQAKIATHSLPMTAQEVKRKEGVPYER